MGKEEVPEERMTKKHPTYISGKPMREGKDEQEGCSDDRGQGIVEFISILIIESI